MIGLLLFCSLVLLGWGAKYQVGEAKDQVGEAKKQVAVIRALSDSVGETVLECRKELEFKREVIRDLLDFWNEKNELTSEDLGCALVCAFEKKEFLSKDGSTVQRDKMMAFYQEIGADVETANRLIELGILCKKETSAIRSFCDSSLELAKCYRYGIFQLKWNPDRFYWKHPSKQDPYELLTP